MDPSPWGSALKLLGWENPPLLGPEAKEPKTIKVFGSGQQQHFRHIPGTGFNET